MATQDIEQLKRRHLREYLRLIYKRLAGWVEEDLQIPRGQRGEVIRQLRLTQNQTRLGAIIVETARGILATGRQSSSTILDA